MMAVTADKKDAKIGFDSDWEKKPNPRTISVAPPTRKAEIKVMGFPAEAELILKLFHSATPRNNMSAQPILSMNPLT